MLRWSAQGAAGAYLTEGAYHSTHGTKCIVILLFHWFEFKELISVEDALSTPLGSAQGGR